VKTKGGVTSLLAIFILISVLSLAEIIPEIQDLATRTSCKIKAGGLETHATCNIYQLAVKSFIGALKTEISRHICIVQN
jgi:hypothetical protein